MNLFRDESPDGGDLILHGCDLGDVRRCLPSRWPVASKRPEIAALERNRALILMAVESSELILASLRSAEPDHVCARPEDCGHPFCRREHDRLDQLGDELLAAGHPKADPLPTDREMNR